METVTLLVVIQGDQITEIQLEEIREALETSALQVSHDAGLKHINVDVIG